jgi:Carboxypeptidase regulatory-like domain
MYEMVPKARMQGFVAAVLLACSWVLPASAQITTGTVSGSLKDAQGAVVPGATVTLVSAARGTATETLTSTQGDFVFANVAPGTYTVRVAMDGFKTVARPGIVVSPGDRVLIPALTIEVGSLNETVTVQAESPAIQASTGERSFTVAPDSVENLPLADRNFATLASLAPGVDGTGRVGGGGATNFMMDGVGTMDTGSNRLLMAVNVESIAEVKVLTSSYQAEYGRSSGLQITAVTKSGTNRFRGSLYDVERNSDWNENSRQNILNGDPKAITKQREWGYSIGGPVGKPGGNNKLFFFYAQEFQPRTAGNDVVRYRMPTALERAGDFSQTTDNNGNPFPYIKDPSLSAACTAAAVAAGSHGCFADGGVIGRIPASRLYQTGVNVLKRYPLPNLSPATGQAYNYEIIRPSESLLAYQPAIRMDYQATPALRTSFKYTGWNQRKQAINGSIPGFNDSIMQNPHVSTMVATANYNLNATTFLEGTWGRSSNEQAGCALQGNGPVFCTGALPVNEQSNLINAGLGELPFLFPNANVLNPDYYAYEVMNGVNPPIWDGTRLQMQPGFNWGGRVSGTNPNFAPPNMPFPGFLNVNRTWDMAISLTKVAGRHTLKTGFYNTHSYKAQQRATWNGTISFNNDTNNPLDSGFGYANAALGIFQQYQQASSYVEGEFIYNNTEAYIQDNWKVSNRLTLDYGLRFVHQQPQYDQLGQASNFLPDKWDPAQAPLLYAAGCANGVYPCSGSNRQAMDPVTGQFLGPNSVLNIGTIVPNTGNQTNGLFLSGQGISKTTYTWPTLALAPRFGMAYDLTGTQKIVLRGGAGLFYDRPDGNAIFPQVQNPPTYKLVTVRYGQLQSLSRAGLTTEGPPALAVYEYDSKLPASWQWNAGTQVMLPWATSMDVAYVGTYGFQLLQGVNLNTVDLGAAFLPQNQDRTLAFNGTAASNALLQDQMRSIRGYAAITQQWGRGWRTFHSLQLAFQRRFQHGVSFGFNDTISLYDHQSAGARLKHNPDGSFSLRADQAEADRLLGTPDTNRLHRLKGNFVWDLPDIHGGGSALKALGLVVNDWRFSGIWTGTTGAPYTVGFSYQNGGGNTNLTGSPDYGARIRIVGDPGSGCSSDPLRQFNATAFQGPDVGSVGLESSNDYLRDCFLSTLDLSIARDIRLGGNRRMQLRVDMFNAPNSAIVTERASTVNLPSPSDQTTITNLPYDANGNVIPSRSLPRGAGVGVATEYQAARRIQAQIRFSF